MHYQIPPSSQRNGSSLEDQEKLPKEQDPETRDNKIQWFATILAGAFIVITFLLSGFFRQDLFKKGVNFIDFYQSTDNEFTMVTYNIFTLFGHLELIGPILGILFLSVKRKFNVFVYLQFFILNVYLIAVTKHAFQDPRPFWVKSQIKQLDWVGCSTQYGFPSGHAWVSLLMYEPIVANFTSLGPFRWALFVLLVFSTIIPISRLYLGVHSTDQILCGMVMSFSFLIIYRFKLQKALFSYSYESALGIKAGRYGALTLFLNLLFIAVPMIIYAINTSTNRISDEQLNNINNACNLEPKLTVESLEGNHMVDGAVISIFCGIFVGFLLAQCFGDKNKWKTYYFGEWKYVENKYFFVKLVIYIALSFLSLGIFLLILPRYTDVNPYIKYVFRIIGGIGFGITLSFWTPYICLKWEFIKSKDQIWLEKVKEIEDAKKQNEKEEKQKQKKKKNKEQKKQEKPISNMKQSKTSYIPQNLRFKERN